MTYQEALDYLDTFVDYERTPQPAAMRTGQLERMRRLCRRLGEPQRAFRSILVAGTNAKGSISAMLYAMLRASSLRVGLYTSPHLEEFRERIRVSPHRLPPRPSEPSSHGAAGREPQAKAVDDDRISETEFAALIEEIRTAIEASGDWTRREEPLTYFEVLTAVAFLQFQRRQVDVAVVEVGLGGRLDATNVLDAAVAVFGSIDVDHTEILGATPAQIAQEKAGIIRPGQMAMTVPQQSEVLGVLRAACAVSGAPLRVCGEEFTVAVGRHTPEGLQVSIAGLRGLYQSVDLPLIGRHQATNAAVAVAALEALSDTGAPHTPVEQGLAEVVWPGRLELVSQAPVVVLDGAHNPSAAQALRATVEELWPQRAVHFLMGMSRDKLVEAVGQILGPLSASVTCTKSRHPRALNPETLAERLKPSCRLIHVVPDPFDAYTYLLNTVNAEDVLVVTGSLFLVRDIRIALRQSHITPRRAVEST